MLSDPRGRANGPNSLAFADGVDRISVLLDQCGTMKQTSSAGIQRELEPTRIVAAILAGGRSERMGGGSKALIDLAGRPMAGHVAERLKTQAGQLLLSVEAVSPEFDVLGLPQVPDRHPGSNGPLGGVASVLQQAADTGCEWLLIAPCDAPFLPSDLGRRLSRAAVAGDSGIAMARYGDRLQPAFSLWHASQLEGLERAVEEQGKVGFFEFLRGRRVDIMEWLPRPLDPFLNVNDRAALERANRILTRADENES
jgi:molybdopterin-guanine dinucleotide biosynthesis protein A